MMMRNISKAEFEKRLAQLSTDGASFTLRSQMLLSTLWRQIESLEKENADLRIALEKAGTSSDIVEDREATIKEIWRALGS